MGELYRPQNDPQTGPEMIPNWTRNDPKVNLGMVWHPSSLCDPEPQARLSSSPKLPQVFESGYVNMASILYFFYKIYDKDSATETTTVPFYLNIKVEIHNTHACTFKSKYTQKNHCYSPQFPSF